MYMNAILTDQCFAYTLWLLNIKYLQQKYTIWDVPIVLTKVCQKKKKLLIVDNAYLLQ